MGQNKKEIILVLLYKNQSKLTWTEALVCLHTIYNMTCMICDGDLTINFQYNICPLNIFRIIANLIMYIMNIDILSRMYSLLLRLWLIACNRQ